MLERLHQRKSSFTATRITVIQGNRRYSGNNSKLISAHEGLRGRNPFDHPHWKVVLQLYPTTWTVLGPRTVCKRTIYFTGSIPAVMVTRFFMFSTMGAPLPDGLSVGV